MSSSLPTRICVFCGSTGGKSPAHVAAAWALAQTMHANNIHLVYGGGSTGLMGEVARTLVQLGGKDAVMGITLVFLLGKERQDKASSEQYGHLTIVPDLQARKKMMVEMIRDGGPGSGFVALSGGIGTMDEVMEVVSLVKMGVHNRGTCLLNVEGCWDGILQWIEKAIEEKFAVENLRHILGSATEAAEAVKWLKHAEDRGTNSE